MNNYISMACQQTSECCLAWLWRSETSDLQSGFSAKPEKIIFDIFQLPKTCCSWSFGRENRNHCYLLHRSSSTQGWPGDRKSASQHRHPECPHSARQCHSPQKVCKVVEGLEPVIPVNQFLTPQKPGRLVNTYKENPTLQHKQPNWHLNSSRSHTAEPSTSSTHSCREPSETGTTCSRKSLRPRPSTHLCQGPPDCSNPKHFVVVVLRCWPSVKWQNNQHDDCGRSTGRTRTTIYASTYSTSCHTEQYKNSFFVRAAVD